MMNMNLGAHYTLARDIDLSAALSSPSGMWTSAGFVPVGNGSTRFTGQFDGQNHIISGLTINRPTTNEVGLFGYANGTIIMNVGLVAVNITGQNEVGSLVGRNNNISTVRNSYSTGSVSGDDSVGGLVGRNNG